MWQWAGLDNGHNPKHGKDLLESPDGYEEKISQVPFRDGTRHWDTRCAEKPRFQTRSYSQKALWSLGEAVLANKQA